MKAKKIACAAYIVLFLGICIVPAAGMYFSDTSTTSENRVLASFPKLKDEKGAINTKWGTEFESYLSDHFAFRQNMVNIYDSIESGLLSTSPQEDVIIGKDGWLYYQPTVNDYVNIPSVSKNGIKHIAKVLSMMNEYAEEHNSKFLFTAVPNKNSIYPENMPARYIQAAQDDTLSMLENELQSTDTAYCNLRESLQKEAQSGELLLYHKLDTHWNNYGALTASEYLLKSAGLPYADYSTASYSIQSNWDGDLYQILFPTGNEKDENIIYDYDFSYYYTTKVRNMDDFVINTKNDGKTGSLLMFRDSFGRALLPFMAENFESASFQRADHYPIDVLEDSPSDLVVLEIVERNLSNILGYAPQMPAPVIEGISADKYDGAAVEPSLNIEKSGKYIHIYGTYDSEFASQDAIYVSLENESGGCTLYEAFPCYEFQLLSDTEPMDNGYSLYIPMDSIDNTVNTVNIIVKYNGEYIDIGKAGQFQIGG